MASSTSTLAILCGGRSRRLGTDKGLHQPLGDEPLVARAVRLWSDAFTETLIVVRDPMQAQLYEAALARHLSEADRARVRLVHDGDLGAPASPHAAIAGVATALALATYADVVVVPVDQLGVRELHLKKLLQARRRTGGQPVAFGIQDAITPFPSLWPKAAFPALMAQIGAGAYGVRDALEALGSQKMPGEEWGDELAFNGNTAADITAYFGAPLFDPFGRRLHYLRFSLTEACNLSCTYCLPEGFPEWYRHKARLGMTEIETLLRGFRTLGFRKIRFTGGEPTVHPRCLDALRMARKLGYERIAMTTNGLLMPDLGPWVDAGLTQLNVSLDSIDPERFYAVTRSREVAKVIQVIEDAVDLGLDVKINTVLLRTRNGDRAGIEQLIDWALGMPVTLRFIELMETKLNGSFAATERVLGTEIEPLLAARGLSLATWDARRPDLRGPSTDYASVRHAGRIGLINPMSCNFCSKCNRLRITAKGQLKLCLFGDNDLPLDMGSPDAVALNVRRLIDRKPERHYLEEGNVGNVATFRTIGG